MQDIITNPFFIQGLGFVGLIFGVWAFYHKNDQKLKTMLMLQSIVLTFHFYLLGSNGGYIATAITAFRNAASLFEKLRKLAPIFLLLYIVLGYYFYEVWTDVLPIIACILGTIGVFYFSGLKMRFFNLSGSACWVVHNILVMSISPLFMEIFIIIMNLSTMYRIYKYKKTKNC